MMRHDLSLSVEISRCRTKYCDAQVSSSRTGRQEQVKPNEACQKYHENQAQANLGLQPGSVAHSQSL